MGKNALRNAAKGAIWAAVSVILALSVPSFGAANVWAVTNRGFADRLFEPVDYSERPYGHYSREAMDQAMADFEKACAKDGQEEEVERLYDQIVSEFDHAATIAYMAQVKYDRDMSDETAVEEQAYTSDLYTELGNKALVCIKKGMDSSYRQLLVEKIGEEYAYGVSYYEDDTPEEQELRKEEEELIREYDQLAVSDLPVEIKGGQWSYQRLETEPDISEAEYYEVKEALDKEKNRVLGGKFLELVRVRNRMAKAAGYENYAEYANEAFYGRDYSLEDAGALCRIVRDVFPDLYDDIWNTDIGNASYESLERLEESTTDDILNTVGPGLEEAVPQLGEIFRYMRDNHLYDIDEAKDGAQRLEGSYTVGMPSYRDAYIFVTRENTFRDYQSVIHEFGHFSSYYYNTVPELYQGYHVDVCEIQSQGLEMLTLSRAEEMFGEGAQAYAFETITDRLYTVITSCIIHEFEEAVYTEPDMTLDDMNRRFAKIQNSYGGWYFPVYDNQCYSWTDISHLFYSPLYYIGYGTSSLSSLDLWILAEKDREKGIDTYMGILKEGMDAPYREAMSDWGMRDVFDSGELESLARDIRNLEKPEADAYGTEEAEPGVAGGTEGEADGTEREAGLSPAERFAMLLGIGTVLVLQVMILCIGLVILWILTKRRNNG